jgi:hypothetical protein
LFCLCFFAGFVVEAPPLASQVKLLGKRAPWPESSALLL